MLSTVTDSKAGLDAADTRLHLRQSALKKNVWRLMPLLIAALIFSYIDKNNAGFAALTMMHDLSITPAQFGWGAGLLFVGYCAFEVPSNLALYKYGARRWLARIMITWGFATAATALAMGPTGFYVLRFILGVAEAGFFPGVTYLLACWFPAEYRARVLALFVLGAPLSSVIGGPMSGFVFQLDGLLGLHGWQWMFIAQGIPAVLVGIGILYFLRDHPKDAEWLTKDERTVLLDQLNAESPPTHKSSFWTQLKDARIFLLGAIQFGFVVSTYGVGIWLPLILNEYGYGVIKIGLLSAIPYVFAVIGTFVWAQRVDKTGNRILHLMLACLLGAIGLALSTLSLGIVIKLIGISLAVLAVFASRAIFWTIPTTFLSGRAAAGGLALINSIGTLGGFVGTVMVGQLKTIYGTFAAGIWAMAIAFFISALLTASLWLFSKEKRGERRA